jgi:hypothetical protein
MAGCGKPIQGVLATVALEEISDEIKELMENVEKDLDVSTDEINAIKERVKNAFEEKPST